MFGMMLEGITAPRRSMRRLLDFGLGFDAIVLIALLSYLIRVIIGIALGGAPSTGHSLTFHLLNLVAMFGAMFMVSEMVFSIGKMAGGHGARNEIYLVVAWHSLVTSLLAPAFAMVQIQEQMVQTEQGEVAMPYIDPGQVLFLLAAGGIALWLLACYVAEAHGFKSIWNVMGSLLMGMVGFLIAVLILASLLSGA